MNLQEAISLLENYNLWHRGSDDVSQPNPTQLGIAISIVLKEVKSKEIRL